MYTALRAASKTIAQFLEARFKADALLSGFFTVGGMVVSTHSRTSIRGLPSRRSFMLLRPLCKPRGYSGARSSSTSVSPCELRLFRGFSRRARAGPQLAAMKDECDSQSSLLGRMAK